MAWYQWLVINIFAGNECFGWLLFHDTKCFLIKTLIEKTEEWHALVRHYYNLPCFLVAVLILTCIYILPSNLLSRMQQKIQTYARLFCRKNTELICRDLVCDFLVTWFDS